MTQTETETEQGNGQRQNGASGNGRNRRDQKPEKPTPEELEIDNFWNRPAAPLPVRDYQWLMIAYRGNKPRGKRWYRLDHMVTNFTWTDELIVKASISLITAHDRFSLLEGHRLVLYVKVEGGKHQKIFDLRVTSVSNSLTGDSMEIEAADQLEWLKKSRNDFAFRKGDGKSKEKRPNGWKAHQITREICKQYGIKVGPLIKGRAEINKMIEKDVSPLSIIEKAYEKERQETGFKYVIRMRNGRLTVRRLRRNRELIVYGGQALDATITRRIKAKMATELRVKGKVKGEDDDKAEDKEITVRVRKKARRRYGYVTNSWTLDEQVESVAKMRRDAKRELADRMEPDREVTLTVPGYPYLERGDAIKVSFKKQGFHEILYVTEVTHTVSAGDYTCGLTLSFDEFYVDKEGEAIREKIVQKAKKKGWKVPRYGNEDFDVFAPTKRRPKRGANRKDRR